jgi:hypothetical protein
VVVDLCSEDCKILKMSIQFCPISMTSSLCYLQILVSLELLFGEFDIPAKLHSIRAGRRVHPSALC